MPRVNLSPAAQRILDALRAAGGRPLIVGGAVRDAFLIRNVNDLGPKDIDIEVYGIATLDALATALHGTGRVKRQGAAYEIVAVTVGTETFDVSLPRTTPGTVEAERAAFAQRDFTVNSLGYDPETGEVVDHWGGVADLRAGVLRHTGPSFADDPLRVLRGVQLAGRFDLIMADETVALARSLADRYDEIPRARVWGEWHAMSSRATFWPRALDTLRRTGWDRHVPELAATQGIEQDPGWHSEGDVWTHLGLAAQAAAEAVSANPAVSPRSRDVIVLGALVHDLGKVTHSQVRDGRITSHGHAAAGVEPAESFLTRIGAPRHLVDSILPIVREHMAHVSLKRSTPNGATVRRLARRLNPDGRGASLAEWAAVVDADCAGRGASSTPSPSPAWIEVAERSGPTPTARLLNGAVLIAHGITPGPTFRQILAASVQAQDNGAFDTVEGAAAWFATSPWAPRGTSIPEVSVVRNDLSENLLNGHSKDMVRPIFTDFLPDGATPLLVGVVGSTAYGLDHADSDVDLLGVFLADPTSLMGLTQPVESIVVHEPDVTVHELRKLLALGLRCNPTVTELLWLTSYEVCNPLGNRILDLRRSLLSETLVRSAYLGYAQAQMSKLLARARSGISDTRAKKHARHMFRLLEQGTDLLTTGTLTIRVRDREWYLDTLPGLSTDQVAQEFATRARQLSEARSVLPTAPDTAAADALLIEARIDAVRALDLT